MPIKDIMLTMLSHPNPTPRWAIEAGAALARRHQARLSATLCVASLPPISNFLADRLVGANQAIADENARSAANADALTAMFGDAAGAKGSDVRRLGCGNVVDPRPLAEHARIFDLALVPLHGHPETVAITESLIFSSGRPVMLLPESPSDIGSRLVVIGWDGSRPAARAMADALPFCRAAEAVQIVAVTGEKALAPDLSLDSVRRHLSAHGIEAALREVPAEGADAGTALLRHCEAEGADLLVMGGYGQSKLREFVLGGATRTVLGGTKLPVLFSH